MQGFGKKLRKQREERGITLDAISGTTKISTRMLRALEEENFSQLPGGVFNKGFVRAYARQVGLDEEESVADYLAALSESQIKSQSLAPDLRSGKAPTGLLQSFRVPRESAVEADPYAASASPAAEQNLLTEDRRLRQERRSDKERRIEARRHEDRKSEDRSRDDRSDTDRKTEDLVSEGVARETEDSDAHHREPWQVENRPAAELLSAAHREDPKETRQPASPAFTTGTFGDAVSNSQNRIPWGAITVAVVIICLGIAFWGVRRHRHPVEASAVLSPEIAPTQISAPAELTVSKLSSANRPNSKTENASSPNGMKPQRIPTAAKPSAAATSSANAPNNPSVANSASRALSQNDSQATRLMSGSPTASSAKTIATTPAKAAAFTLLIRAEKTSWVSIAADGKLVAEETLIAPAEKSVRAANQIVVKTGNAAGVSFLFNSKQIPASGNDGEVKIYTFDASGMKAPPDSAAAVTH